MLVLGYYEGLDDAEIAGQLGCSPRQRPLLQIPRAGHAARRVDRARADWG
jgi:hypothetical protein